MKAIKVGRQPNLSCAYALTSRPASWPTREELDSPDCQGAGISLCPTPGSYTPNLSWNCVWPKNELIYVQDVSELLYPDEKKMFGNMLRTMTKSYPSMIRLVDRNIAQKAAFLYFLNASRTVNSLSAASLSCACWMSSMISGLLRSKPWSSCSFRTIFSVAIPIQMSMPRQRMSDVSEYRR